MLFKTLLLNFLVAGMAVSSVVVPAADERTKRVMEKKSGKRGLHEEVTESVLIEYASSVEVCIQEKGPSILKDCDKGHAEDVKDGLEEIVDKFSSLRQQCHKGIITFEFEQIEEFCHQFVKLLKKFQTILWAIKKHVLIAEACGVELFKCGFELNEIFKFIVSYKVDFLGFAISLGIDFSLFAGIGFSVPHLD
ncbi:hypothetical protein VP01_191g18 [Puccinia sorghi]|uniref:Uncharacterized protein n=1 Tax=Puccinia sorghi TaxID=27349 RepID=A0A0L6VCR1_9BASI|nr:hypothetical protein VP01_191g18 [Puccinia sorghi]